jgi:thioredoxin reductase (NADPH)
MYDVIIIGTGCAGMTAGVYALRYNLKSIIIGKDLGGVANEAHKVENWPSYPSISGMDLMNKFKKNIDYLKGEIVNDEVVEICKKKDIFTIKTEKEIYKSKALILAVGLRRRKLNIKGEDDFFGKGLTYCATCDAPFFKDKIVGVVGGSDSAARAAQLCSEYAKKVYVIYRKDKMRAEPMLVQHLEEDNNVEFIFNTNVSEAMGSNFLEKVKLDNGKELEVQGLVIEVGSIPSTNLFKELKVRYDNQGYILVNESMATNVKGVYAAGDITTGSNMMRQIITGAAEGAIAAESVFKLIKNMEHESN